MKIVSKTCESWLSIFFFYCIFKLFLQNFNSASKFLLPKFQINKTAQIRRRTTQIGQFPRLKKSLVLVYKSGFCHLEYHF